MTFDHDTLWLNFATLPKIRRIKMCFPTHWGIWNENPAGTACKSKKVFLAHPPPPNTQYGHQVRTWLDGGGRGRGGGAGRRRVHDVAERDAGGHLVGPRAGPSRGHLLSGEDIAGRTSGRVPHPAGGREARVRGERKTSVRVAATVSEKNCDDRTEQGLVVVYSVRYNGSKWYCSSVGFQVIWPTFVEENVCTILIFRWLKTIGLVATNLCTPCQ